MTRATGVTHALPVPEPLQRRTPARRLTAAEVQEIHGVPASTVRSWAISRRGRPPRIYPIGVIPGKNGGRDSPVYDERKLQPLIAEWQARRRTDQEMP